MDNLYVTITDNEPINIGLSITEDPINLSITNIDTDNIDIQLSITEEPIDIAMVIAEDPFEVVFATMTEIGPAGPSAYEVAVANGFSGTEAEWLASLQGETGQDGADYQLSWINYVVGYDVEPQLTTTPLPGELYIYAYQDATTLYRYIANDYSEDAFYDTYENDALSGLIATKRM